MGPVEWRSVRRGEGLGGVVIVGVVLYAVTKLRRRRAERLADAELEVES